MGRPSIGELDTSLNEAAAINRERLTVLEEGSKESIYNLIFAVGEKSDEKKGADVWQQ